MNRILLSCDNQQIFVLKETVMDWSWNVNFMKHGVTLGFRKRSYKKIQCPALAQVFQPGMCASMTYALPIDSFIL